MVDQMLFFWLEEVKIAGLVFLAADVRRCAPRWVQASARDSGKQGGNEMQRVGFKT